MNGSQTVNTLLVILFTGALAACASPSPESILGGGEAQLKNRSMQTRVFDTSDKQLVLRTVVTTLQDIGFMIEQADATLGTVSARKFVVERDMPRDIRMMVTVRPRDSQRMLVRANAEFNNKPIDDPLAYQNFFVALAKALFLTAQQAD
jgi:hypothetical protein